VNQGALDVSKEANMMARMKLVVKGCEVQAVGMMVKIEVA